MADSWPFRQHLALPIACDTRVIGSAAVQYVADHSPVIQYLDRVLNTGGVGPGITGATGAASTVPGPQGLLGPVGPTGPVGGYSTPAGVDGSLQYRVGTSTSLAGSILLKWDDTSRSLTLAGSTVVGPPPNAAYPTANVALWTVPAGVTQVTVKLWGAGGGSFYNVGGGQGGFVVKQVAVSAGQQYVLSTGQGGQGYSLTEAPNAGGTAAGANNGAGGPSFEGTVGGGGQYSAIHLVGGTSSSPTFTLVACAGGGGGAGSAGSDGSAGSAGGNAVATGSGSGYQLTSSGTLTPLVLNPGGNGVVPAIGAGGGGGNGGGYGGGANAGNGTVPGVGGGNYIGTAGSRDYSYAGGSAAAYSDPDYPGGGVAQGSPQYTTDGEYAASGYVLVKIGTPLQVSTGLATASSTLDDGLGNLTAGGNVTANGGHLITPATTTFDAYNPASSSTVYTWRNDTASNTLTGATTLMTLTTGSVLTVGSTQYTSDRRLKANIEALTDDQCSALLKLRPVSYHKLATPDRVEMGLIAQEVREVLPRLVNPSDGEDSHLTVDYVQLIAPLVRLAQMQERRIQRLEEALATVQ